MSHCKQCFASTRVFGICTECNPKPGALVQDPTLRWFLDTLAEAVEHSLTDDQCGLIQAAAKGQLLGGHLLEKVRVEEGAAAKFAASPEASASGAYVGTPPKGRWEGTVLCERVIPLGPGEYGERFLLIFTTETEDGTDATLVWFTGEGGKFDPQEGESYMIRATVKEHKVYNGVRQTVIQRPKQLEEEDSDGGP